MLKHLFVVLLVIFTAAGCSQPDSVVKVAGPTMGTQYHVSWIGQNDSAEQIQHLIDQRLADINRIMSTYDPDSELSQLNRQTLALDNVTLSEELADVLAQALMIYNQSEGRFDVTVGPLVNAWGFGPGKHRDQKLSEEEVNGLLAGIGSDAIHLDDRTLSTDKPLYIDLSAIAKGWAVDQIGYLLEQQGVVSYLVEIGGELRARGSKPDGSGWRVAIERPALDSMAHQVQLVLEPGDSALATSGDYRNYFEEQGVRYSHTIDPHTGYPITHQLASVTILNPSCALADAWATALTVAGPEQAVLLANRYQLTMYAIVRTGDGFTELASDEFLRRFPGLMQGNE
ncbi:FAD:protein FMN transferase [Oceanobacter sp. 5_MG-2023]|uniref:FAD:protein FMN transferase n=1 Tax=Oceanobacter sp. 5_MG-2023 TaxID=3062645 RepID=UPI0026E3C635|nr:FAD:protein FMN transferase [Oceanobacter sp. 5_MG-2023]MDO6681136.1 FAD:protein FMN transferase [Oceanobacter sp. 5_MG-2023]